MDVDRDLVALGLRDALAGGDARLTDIEMRKLVTEYHRKRQLEQKRAVRERDEIYKAQAEKNKRDGEAFLARNRARSGVETTSSGLQYRVMRPGTGKSPTATGTVVLHYRGRLIDGKEFDSSYERGEPTTFRVNRVIDGWTEALQLMREGAKWEVVVPSPLAYGRSGLKPDVGPNAVLIFETVSCGDGACAPDENCENCEADCGACPDVFVGDPNAVAPLVASQPRFIWFGTKVGASMRAMTAGLDINGDGLGDFVAGGLDWDRTGANNAGGFSVVFGRPAEVDGVSVPAGDTVEICAADWTYMGLRAADYVGGWHGMTSAGYLNDDSCEDFAVGAYVEDFDNSSQGTVRVFFGWGGVDCPEEPTY
ncbi:MAG: FKBP-type peptidyl-prolyl cis-trans isomerase, partial [Myxococcota bacterium]|nr:FKBP-type peptidyl-prolyl cis-trans isomerase [Myxococcota bacterium]